MKNKNIKIFAGVLAILGAYFIYRYYKKPKPDEIIKPQEPTPIYNPRTTANDKYPLRKGSKGDNVKAIQKLILGIDSTLLPKFGADGDFGSETESALQKLIGKKSVDNNTDYGKLLNLYNQKKFPLVTKSDNNPFEFKRPF